MGKIIDSFNTPGRISKGLPLGNLTSQLLVNIYLNEFDHFIKRQLKIKYYIRYADDFVIFHENRLYLETILPQISEFLKYELKLELHSDKLFIRTLNSGLDFLGWINFPEYKVLRQATKKRMFRKLKEGGYKEESLCSYLGMVGHGNAFKIKKKLLSKRPANSYLN